LYRKSIFCTNLLLTNINYFFTAINVFTISDVDISDIEVFPGKEAGLGIFSTFFEANAYYTQRTSENTQFVEACLY
jgi:hypothetical protein